MKRLALLHTVPFLVDLFRPKLTARLPGLDYFNIVDESLLQDFSRAGGLTPPIIRRMAAQASLAREAGAQVILFTCSSTSPGVDVVRKLLDVPILKIDDPLAEKAVSLARRIGLICTAATTLKPSQGLLQEHAAAQAKEIEIVPHLEASAFQALLAGDKAGHDYLVSAAATDLAPLVDVVVLAQASMAHLAQALGDRLPVPVLASPDLAVEAVARLVAE
jgi:Asp/Glu/hydantoin racemase